MATRPQGGDFRRISMDKEPEDGIAKEPSDSRKSFPSEKLQEKEHKTRHYTSATLKINLPEAKEGESQLTTVEEIMALKPLDLAAFPLPSLESSREKEEWGQYSILGVISQTSSRSLLLVKDKNTRRCLVMKVLLFTPELEKEQMQRFLEEAQILSQLEHPAIVPLHEIGLDVDGQIYFTMRYIPGCNLQEFRKTQKGLTVPALLLLFAQICQAVAYTHERGVFHGNLNPHNILVDTHNKPYLTGWSSCSYKGGGIKVFDYGANRLIRQNGGLQTIDGRIVGIANYIAPEIVLGNKAFVEERSEVYALGAILYTMIAGKPPYEGANTAATIQNIGENRLSLPKKSDYGGIPNKLRQIVYKAMASNKTERYQSALDLFHAIERLLIQGPGFLRHW
jgi:serine/threonine-protein kinase